MEGLCIHKVPMLGCSGLQKPKDHTKGQEAPCQLFPLPETHHHLPAIVDFSFWIRDIPGFSCYLSGHL